MEKNYKTLDVYFGTIEEAVVKLITHTVKNKGELVCCEFNGNMLYSDTVSLDDAYKNIAGKTYNEFNENQKSYIEEIKRKEEEHKDAIPNLTKLWIVKGHAILSSDRWALWDKIVPIRLGDLYHGMELECCLDIVEALNGGCTLDYAKKQIEDQNHSGMSFGLVCSMVKEFCDRGVEFVKYVR